jgi:hypothetical protein
MVETLCDRENKLTFGTTQQWSREMEYDEQNHPGLSVALSAPGLAKTNVNSAATVDTRWATLFAHGGAAFASRLRRRRHDDKRAHKAELHTWENEGGNLRPCPEAPVIP